MVCSINEFCGLKTIDGVRLVATRTFVSAVSTTTLVLAKSFALFVSVILPPPKAAVKVRVPEFVGCNWTLNNLNPPLLMLPRLTTD